MQVQGSTRGDDSWVRVKWRVVAIANGLLASAALTTIVILVATTDAQALSSVALILAVLAFVIQIVVFIADFSFNEKRSRESSELNTATQVLLAKIEAKTDSTNDIVQKQMQRVFEKFVLDVKADGSADSADQSVMLATLRESFDRAVAESQPSNRRLPNSQPDPDLPVSPGRRRRLETWPSAATMQSLARSGANDLPAGALDAIKELGDDVRMSARVGVVEGISLNDLSAEALDALQSKGFMRQHRENAGIWVLTAKGFEVARLMYAANPVPETASETFPWLREFRSI
jgi:heme/copper-type cytochrome/quinol oxidase subunit 4